ncbi:unnamed protein product [Protopolystoma xenopodis]|uniref:Cadherin domain-containing protein n=1 Tax=Protopolystoma xenopodis TaxID=117903 RepID=A0A3S5BTK5_9PLAT|nr:unnamed protein product [Protopolystoma xenopodis]
MLPNELLEPFSLRRTRDGASLVLKGRLDREVVSAYDLNLVALDGGRPVARSSHLSLRILISDANDNAPVWLAPVPSHLSAGDDDDRPASRRGADTTEAVLPRYEVTLAEDIKVGSLVAWPQASDADAGDNARLAYAIDTSAPGGQAALDQFSVQSSTGEVRLRLPLNYEALAAAASQSTDSRDSMTRDRRGDVELELPLIVRDSPRTGRPLSSSALLVVHVVDVNDAPPSIVVSPLTSVRDHQRLVGTGLSVRPPPVYDSAMPGLTTRLFEGGPRRESRSVFGVWENRAPGQPVASVFVTDPDTGPGGLVSCSLQRTDAFRLQAESARRFGGKETVDEDSAEDPEAVPIAPGSRTYQLVSTQRLDREERSVFQLVITCRDHDPRQPLMASQRVHIAVLDENDNQPVFTRPVFQLSLPEHSAPGRLIGRVNATDADFGRNGQLRYWAAPEAESWVSVHPVTGEVHVNAILDREVEPERRFLVYAADQAEPSTAAFTATSMVVVRVLDENDHVPQFTNLYFFSVLENSPSGTLVGRVEATDEDEGKNGQVRRTVGIQLVQILCNHNLLNKTIPVCILFS